MKYREVAELVASEGATVAASASVGAGLPASYPHLTDDEFVATHLDRWLT